MLVKDLIKLLQHEDQNAVVTINHPDYVGSKYYPVKRVRDEFCYEVDDLSKNKYYREYEEKYADNKPEINILVITG